MRRTTLNLILDGLAALLMVGLICTGIIVRFVLPAGSGKDTFLWDLSRHQWGDVHFWLAVSLIVIVILHVATHWTWVVVMTAGRRDAARKPEAASRSRWLSGLVLLLVLAGMVWAFSWLTMRNVQHEYPSGTARTQPHSGKATGQLRGSMTLSEVADSTGLPIEEIRKRLALPDSVPDAETLGRLGREYGFTIGQARERLGDTPPGDRERP